MKTYQKPTTDITMLETINMIAASNNYNEPEKGQDLGNVGETTETSGNLSRRRSVWDDEDELLDEQY